MVFEVGVEDDFALPTEPTAPDADLAEFMGVNVRQFDQTGIDLRFGHTFVDLPSGICAARLEISLMADDGTGNDNLNLEFDPEGPRFGWGQSLAILTGLNWTTGDQMVLELDLADLPPSSQGVTDILDSLADGDLDVYVQDDTSIDYIRLSVEYCPPPPECMRIPWGLVGWWPFNEPDQGVSGRWSDVARGHEAIARFAPDSIDGKVGRAVSFDGNLDEVVVQDADDLDFPAGFDLSIDFWIRTDTINLSVVLDKRTATPSVLGYQVFLVGGEVGLQLAEGVGSNTCSSNPAISACTNYVSDAFVADGEWHLVAVTVDRDDPAGGTWYLDGEEVGPRFNPTLRGGSLANDGQLLIGDRAFDGTAPYNGDLDELEILGRVLTADEIRGIYDAGPSGKCTLSVDAPWDQALCEDQNSVVPQISACNSSGDTRLVEFDFESLPRDPPGIPHGGLCEAAGPTRFSLLGSAPLVIPAGECRTAKVRITDPPAQTSGQASCYKVTATDVVSGQAVADFGFIPATNTVCCEPDDPVTPVPWEPVNPSSVLFRLADTGLGSPDLDVRVEVFENADGSPPALRLADAAAGEAIERRVSFGPDGIAALEVPVALTEEATPQSFYDVVLSAELDGDPDPEFLASATVFASPGPCAAGLNGLCLNQDRFRVEARWRTAEGDHGVAQAVPLTSDTGFFWFFNDANLELVVKVLDACNSPFDSFWVFAGGLTNVEVELTVTDLLTGASKSYFNPLDTPFKPILDTSAFATCDAGGEEALPEEATPSAVKLLTELPLRDDRFVVEVEWESPQGASGSGEAVPLTSDTGYFWFFSANNVELVVKVLDACNTSFHRYWVFAAGLTDVEVRMTVTDTTTGATTTYDNPQGNPFQPILDVGAFDTCP
jgi:hypothetical protein